MRRERKKNADEVVNSWLGQGRGGGGGGVERGAGDGLK